MEKSRAIELLEHLVWDGDIERNPYGDALNIAIEALKAQLSQEGATSDTISRQAAIDALSQPEIVRCGECRHKNTRNCLLNLWATIFNSEPKDDFFCGMAERRTE